MDDAAARERVARLDTLLEQIEDDGRALETVQALIELYGEALARLVRGVDPVEDELVSHLLLVHGLHPSPVEERVQAALDGVRPYLGSHGGDVELLDVSDGAAHVRLRGTCNGCPSSSVTLQNAVEAAILEAAPEVERVEAEGVAEPAPAGPQLLQIGSLTCPTELARP